MKTLLTIMLSFVILIAIATPFSYAQNGNRPVLRETVRKDLERTDAVIERAKQAIERSNAPVANQSLTSAISIQGKAWEQFQLDYLRIARQMTLEARELAKQAMSRARIVEQGEEELSRRLDRVEEALARIAEVHPSNDNSPFGSLYMLTKENLRRAREFYNDKQYIAAYRLMKQVERSIWRLTRAAKRDGRWFEQYENRAMEVSDLIDRVKDQIAECGVASAETLLSQAEETFKRAEEFADKDQLKPALQSLQKAQEMANDAASQCQGPASLEKTYEHLTNKLERLKSQLSAQDEEAKMLIAQAEEQLLLARRHLDTGNVDQAAAALRATQLALRQAEEYLGSNKH